MRKRSKEDLYLFYIGKEPDLYGRWFDDILGKSALWLENSHNYIQRIFPLMETSAYDKKAPVMDAETLFVMQEDPIVRENMLQALQVMLKFYGLQLAYDEQGCVITKTGIVHHWINPFNHNYKRITRILKSLRLMKLEEEASALFDCLSSLYDKYSLLIGEDTYIYWKKAMM